MARKSRKIVLTLDRAFEENHMKIISGEKIYKTAIYARLSSEDSGNKDGGSIDSQILIVRKYIESEPYLKLCETFTDNGETGTNFERDGWRNLMEAVKCGKINCIIVKDLSRFGRDYIETGSYLEKVFPFLGVRFISVNDNYDSENPIKNGDNLTVILKNLINDMYAKDISRKVKSAYHTMQKNGEYVASRTPYGYMKSPENKHKLVMDEEVAPIVREIFRWKSEGMNNTAIARKLNNNGVTSPSNYFYGKGISANPKYAKKIFWNDSHVRVILSNIVYMGHIAQGKSKRTSINKLPAQIQPKEKWIVVENTHEPIIDGDTFAEAQKIISERSEMCNNAKGKYNDIKRTENIFTGLIYCANCGKALKRKQLVRYGKRCYSFVCPSYSFHVERECVRKYVQEKNLKDIVFCTIKQQISLLCEIDNKVKNVNLSVKIKNRELELQAEIQGLEQKLTNINSRKITLYDDFTDGLLTEREYHYARQKYDSENNSLAFELQAISDELIKYKDSFIAYKKYAAEILQFDKFTELTREMLTALVEKIIVYSDRRIEIKFKYRDEFKELQDYITENEASV